MNVEEIREYAIALPDVEESFPFDDQTLVFKTGGKIFLLLSLDAQPISFNVKCNPEKAIELREEYEAVKPGYHMNKKHWNTVVCDGSLGEAFLKEQIDHSYDLIAKAKPKKKGA